MSRKIGAKTAAEVTALPQPTPLELMAELKKVHARLDFLMKAQGEIVQAIIQLAQQRMPAEIEDPASLPMIAGPH